jgi:hypothetical protein
LVITKPIFTGLLILTLALSVVAYPLSAAAQNPDENSNGKPQIVSAMGTIPGKGLNVHIWVLVPHGVDKDEVVSQALAKHGALPFVSEKFTTTPLYWDQFGDGSLNNDFVTQNYNPLNDPSIGGGLTALLNTQSTWSNVDSSSFTFLYGGQTNRCPSLVQECPGSQFFDGYNDFAWLPLAQNNVLGVTWSGTTIDEADIALNTNFSWATNGNDIDIETVLLHENGHALGLGHSLDLEAVMYASYHGVLRFLQPDDIAGVSSLYPSSSDPPPPNNPPVAFNQDVVTSEDNVQAITLTGSDADADPLTFSIVSNPTDGILSGFNAGNGDVTYTPNANNNGSDSFTFKVNDGTIDSNTATVSITINESTQNQAPTLTLNRPIDGSQYDEGASITFWASATDNEDDSLSSQIQWSSSEDGFLATDNFFPWSTLSAGTHTITAQVTDSGGLSDTKSVQITINGQIPPANTAPTVSITSPSTGSPQIQWSSNIDNAIGSGASFDTSDLSVGTHEITAQVTDSGGMSDTDSKTITINGPIQTSVTITSPQNNETVKGKFTISADITGFEGLTTVKFMVDGETIATDQASPYQTTVFVKDFSKGQHTLVVEVSDANNFITDSIVFKRK